MDEIIYQKFLTTRICDLDLDADESLGHCFKRLKRELKGHRILLWPDFYFGNEWGCVNKKISISIPFYYATPELKELKGDVPTSEGIVKTLRQETGKAVNHAFAIWLDPRSHWERKYRNWPNALEKLTYVDHLMEEIAGEEPLNLKRKREGEYAEIEDTVSEWWGLDGEMLDQELQEYLNDMNELLIKPTK